MWGVISTMYLIITWDDDGVWKSTSGGHLCSEWAGEIQAEKNT